MGVELFAYEGRLPSRIVARTGGDAIGLKGEPALKLADLRAAHEAWLPQYMAAAH